MSEEGPVGAAASAGEEASSGGGHRHGHVTAVEVAEIAKEGEGATPSSSSFSVAGQEEQTLRGEILRALHRDLLACDIQISLFVAAATSYRHDSVLKPFPPMFDKETESGMDKLRETLQMLSNLETLKCRLTNGQPVPLQLLRLVHWILLENPMGLKISSVDDAQRGEVLNLPCNDNAAPGTEAPTPTHVFKVENNKSQKWEETLLSESQDPNKTLFGFHGSRTENFHSILSHGLQQHLNTNALFGQGIYLSTELGMSLTYSKIGQTWDRSLIGDQMSCVMLCQVMDHKDVKLNTDDPDRNYVSGSEGGKVPEKYLVVRNNDLLVNRYLLVYATRKSNNSLAGKRRTVIPSWIWEHKFILLLIGYAFLLIAVGLSNSPSFKRLLRKRGFIAD